MSRNEPSAHEHARLVDRAAGDFPPHEPQGRARLSPGRHSRNQGGRACCPQRAANVNRHSYKLRAEDRHALPSNGKINRKMKEFHLYYPARPCCGCKMEAGCSGQTRPTTIGFRGTMPVFARGILSLRERKNGPAPRILFRNWDAPRRHSPSALELALMIVPNNIEDKAQTTRRGDKKTNDRQSRITEEFERGLHTHQQSSTHD